MTQNAPRKVSREATVLYSRVIGALTAQWSATVTFRTVAEKGLPWAQVGLTMENERLVTDIQSGTEFDTVIPDKRAFLDHFGGPSGFTKQLTDRQLTTARAAVDAASLVFVHSAVDAAVSDLCEVSALVAPEDWNAWLGLKQVALARLSHDSLPHVRREELAKIVAGLRRDSLMKRVDRLFELCRPPSDLSLITDFRFDRDKMEALDKARQGIIHGEGIDAAPDSIEQSLIQLNKSGLFLFALLNWKYGVRIDPLVGIGMNPDIATQIRSAAANMRTGPA